MKRVLFPAAIAAAALMVFAVVNATAKGQARTYGQAIHVIEHATSDQVTNGAATNNELRQRRVDLRGHPGHRRPP
jgi:hypothetical protein